MHTSLAQSPRRFERLATIAFFLTVAPLAGLARADDQWTLVKSTLTYHVSHPLHESEGVSHEARGKAICRAGQCDVLVAVPVKSFDSGDSNRDLHMLQVTRGARYPMVTVRSRFPETAAASPDVNVDLDVEFAGHSVHYSGVSFHQTTAGGETHITGTIPAKLSDFKIDPPSLLALPTKNDIPVRVDLTVRRGPAH